MYEHVFVRSFVSAQRAFSSVSLRVTCKCMNMAGVLGLSRDAFISGALRELSVALCRGNASLGRSGLYALPRASGRASLVPPPR
jgi:hypothetical protein